MTTRKLMAMICAAMVGLLGATPAFGYTETDPTTVAADALIARPACFVATIVGSVVFVISLPVAATSHSVKRAADALVRKPAWATFRRPLGDFSYAENY